MNILLYLICVSLGLSLPPTDLSSISSLDNYAELLEAKDITMNILIQMTKDQLRQLESPVLDIDLEYMKVYQTAWTAKSNRGRLMVVLKRKLGKKEEEKVKAEKEMKE